MEFFDKVTVAGKYERIMNTVLIIGELYKSQKQIGKKIYNLHKNGGLYLAPGGQGGRIPPENVLKGRKMSRGEGLGCIVQGKMVK